MEITHSGRCRECLRKAVQIQFDYSSEYHFCMCFTLLANSRLTLGSLVCVPFLNNMMMFLGPKLNFIGLAHFQAICVRGVCGWWCMCWLAGCLFATTRGKRHNATDDRQNSVGEHHLADLVAQSESREPRDKQERVAGDTEHSVN